MNKQKELENEIVEEIEEYLEQNCNYINSEAEAREIAIKLAIQKGRQIERDGIIKIIRNGEWFGLRELIDMIKKQEFLNSLGEKEK